MNFIDEYRDRFGGVEPICRALTEHGCSIDPSTYHHFKKRPPSARATRDAELTVLIRRIHADNYGVYGCARSGGNCSGRATRWPAAPWNG